MGQVVKATVEVMKAAGLPVKASGEAGGEKCADVIAPAEGAGPVRWLACDCGATVPVVKGEAVCLECRAVYHPEPEAAATRFSGRFRATELGPGWENYGTLAELCETAGLTRRQAQIVLLFSRGWSWAQMAPVLRVSRTNARHYFLIAMTRISRSRPHIMEERREWAKTVLSCFRQRCGNPKAQVYDERGRPVMNRARLVAEDDLIGEERDLLAELVADLKGE